MKNYVVNKIFINKFFLVLFTYVLTSQVYCAEIVHSYIHKNYSSAEKSQSFLKFIGQSKKLGFISASFTGHAKKFFIKAKFQDGVFSQVEVSFPVLEIDTDNSIRNDKMHQETLGYLEKKSFSHKIQVFLESPIKAGTGQREVPAMMVIRGKQKKISVNLEVKKRGDEYLVSGESSLSIKFLELPDPSIAVATVLDTITVKFFIIIPRS